MSGFKYKYSLLVDGKSYEQFKENQAKVMKTWETAVESKLYRVVLGNLFFIFVFNPALNVIFCAVEKATLNIFLNGKIVEENVKNEDSV